MQKTHASFRSIFPAVCALALCGYTVLAVVAAGDAAGFPAEVSVEAQTWQGVFDADLPRRLINVVPAGLILAALLLSWTMVLRRQVARRTAQLQEATGRMTALVSNLPGVAYRKVYAGGGSRITFISDHSQELFGYLPDEICAMAEGQRRMALWHPGDWETLSRVGAETLSDCGRGEARLRARRPDGTETYILLREKVVARDDSSVVVEGLMFDIDREVRFQQAILAQEDELRETSRRLATLIDHLPGVAFRTRYRPDGSRQHLYLSSGCQDHYGVTPEELCAQENDDRGVGADALRAIYHQLQTDGTFEKVEHKVHADGTLRHMLCRGRLVERDGDSLIAEGIAIDITAQMRAEEALSRNNVMLETMIGNLPGGVFRVQYDASGGRRVLFMDGGIIRRVPGLRERICGANGQLHMDFCHPDDRELLEVELPRRLRETGKSEHTFRFVLPDGQTVWLHAWERLAARLGSEIISEGLMLDISAEVLAKKALAEEESKLRRVNERLAEARRLGALGDLAGGIAHDFNNLLGAILGYARFIADDAPDGEVHGYAEKILTAGRRGQNIVDQVLTLTGRQGVTRSRFGLAALICDIAAGLRDLPAYAEVVIDAGERSAVIDADRRQLVQVLENLCHNAVESLGEQPGTVTVEFHPTHTGSAACRHLAERKDAETAWVVDTGHEDGEFWAVTGTMPSEPSRYLSIVVSDTGCGMDATLLANAFAPFFTTREWAKKAGLGLPVVQGVALSHGGAVAVSSKPGGGTRVEVMLPVISPEAIPVPAGDSWVGDCGGHVPFVPGAVSSAQASVSASAAGGPVPSGYAGRAGRTTGGGIRWVQGRRAL